MVLSAVWIFVSLTTVTVTLALVFCVSFLQDFFFSLGSLEKNKLFTGLGSVYIVKNCDLRLENAALSLRPWAAFLRPWSQFLTIQTSQPSNNIYLFCEYFFLFWSNILLFGCDIHLEKLTFKNCKISRWEKY